MTKQSTPKTAVVVLSWNGKNETLACLDALKKQTVAHTIIVVENGSTDGSVNLLRRYTGVILLEQSKNLGFDGGVNVGIKYAIDHDFEYVALLNNDAIPHKDWLAHLTHTLETQSKTGIVTCKLLTADKTHIDSTGEMYTGWGLPYPRGRGVVADSSFDTATTILAASGGASLYRISVFLQIGLFDERFFAYYEDVDISLRAQLAGWKIAYNPRALAYHQIGMSGNKIKGFFTYQTMKNLPMLFWKNVPLRYVPIVFPRLFLAYWLFVFNAFTNGNGITALKGNFAWLLLIPHTFKERRRIQKNKVVTDEYIWSLFIHDLPPNAHRLRALRAKWWKLTRKDIS